MKVPGIPLAAGVSENPLKVEADGLDGANRLEWKFHHPAFSFIVH